MFISSPTPLVSTWFLNFNFLIKFWGHPLFNVKRYLYESEIDTNLEFQNYFQLVSLFWGFLKGSIYHFLWKINLISWLSIVTFHCTTWSASFVKRKLLQKCRITKRYHVKNYITRSGYFYSCHKSTVKLILRIVKKAIYCLH